MPKGFAHLLLLLILLVGLGLGVYLVQNTQIFKSRANLEQQRAQEIEKLTSELQAGKSTSKEGLSAQTISSLQTKAILRKDKLLQEIESSPDDFLQHATLGDPKLDFPEEIKRYLEENVELEGELNLAHFDDPEKRSAVNQQFLKVDSATSSYIQVLLPKNLKITTNGKYRVKGVKLEEKMVAKDLPKVIRVQSLRAIPSDIRIGVFMIKFEDSDPTYTNHEEVYQKYFYGEKSVKKYYEEVSRGKITVSVQGGVFGWYKLSRNSTSDCNWNRWSDEVLTIAAQNQVNTSEFDYYVFTFVPPQGCSFPGSSWAYINHNRSWVMRFDEQTDLPHHELGHNFGNNHASGLACSGEVVNEGYANCQKDEYGDPYDVMGSGLHHFNTPHKETVGWLDPSQIKPISQNGIYTINPLSSPNPQTAALKIRKADSNEYYYIEYRQPNRFDAPQHSAEQLSGLTKGVTIRIWDGNWLSNTRLVDMAKGTGGRFSNAALSDGGEFYDQKNRIIIKQLSHNPQEARVEISFLPENSQTTTSLIGRWQNLTTYPYTVRNHALLISSGYLFSIGGFGNNGAEDKAYSAKINSNGSLGSWNQIKPLPEARSHYASIEYNGYLYIGGGFKKVPAGSSTAPQDSLYLAKTNLDGTINEWKSLKKLPRPFFNHSLLVVDSKLYLVAKEENKANGQLLIYRTQINSDGSIGEWSEILTASNIPTFPKVVLTQKVIYLISGSQLYKSVIENSGNISTFTRVNSLPEPLGGFSFNTHNNYLVVIGGYKEERDKVIEPRPNTYLAKINSDGTIGSWSKDTQLISSLYDHSSIISNNYLYLLGGVSGNTLQSSLFIAPLFGASLIVSPTVVPTPVSSSASSSSGNNYCTPCKADINQDKKVNLKDFSRLSACFGKKATETDGQNLCILSDLDSNGSVNIRDFSCLKSQYNKTC